MYPVAKNPLRIHARRTSVGLVLAVATLGLTVGPGSASAPAADVAKKAAPCERPSHGFKPAEARIPAIGRTVRVILVKRTSRNAVGAGPVTRSGKWLMAMDPQTRPASGRGSVILSAHAWPDGSALGNALQEDLRSGHRITLVGKYGEQACYGIYKRRSYPKDEVPTRDAFNPGGRERLLIVTCSGKRTSPGNWTHRTLWYGLPVTPDAPPKPPSSNPPPDDNSSGSLLGGIFGGLFG